MPSRRAFLATLALPFLAGCVAGIPPAATGATAAAVDVLRAGMDAHGGAAFAGIADIAVAYTGRWAPFASLLQPTLVDAGHRGNSEERLLLRERILAQAHAGPAGRKQVVRQGARNGEGEVRVWFDGQEAADRDWRHAAALVADAYGLFLLGPLLVGQWVADGRAAVDLAEPEHISQDGSLHPCDVVRIRLVPGLGLSEGDQAALYLDAGTRLMRRVRFTLEGLDGTRGAVADVDTLDHVAFAGVQWPTRFHEQLLRPLPLPVHDWRLAGLDVNRGLVAAEVSGPAFLGRAATAATRWG